VISLTTTPIMCALLLRQQPHGKAGKRPGFTDRLQGFYGRTLGWALDHSLIVALTLIATIGLTIYLYIVIPKGFFPEEDTGRLTGSIQADQTISFQSMSRKLSQIMDIVGHDPAVQTVVGFTGTGSGGGGSAQTNTGSVFVTLKDKSKRDALEPVMSRLRKSLANVVGSRLFLQPVQDIRIGGRQSNATYQYTLQADTPEEVYGWAPKLLAELQKEPVLTDLNSDQQQGGLETDVTIDRKTASRLNLTMSQIDNLLYDAFGQRQVATLYESLNQYHVVMEAAPKYWADPDSLNLIWLSTSGGAATGTETTALSPGTVTAAATSAASSGGGAGSAVTTACGTAASGISTAAANPTGTTSAAVSSTDSAGTVTGTLVSVELPTAVFASVAAAGRSSGSSTSCSASGTSGASSGSGGDTTSSSSSTANAAAGSSAENAAQNAISSTGHGSASSGSAVSTASDTMVPLSAIARFASGNTPLGVNHQSQFVATTLSFNLAAGKSLSDAVAAIDAAKQRIGMPSTVNGIFAGTAEAYQQSLSTEPLLVGAALIAVYIVLGILYESFIHPLTILSSLPSAGLGALLAMLLFRMEFTIISLIGVILLIGIVKKNAILMIDFAIHTQREKNIPARDAIHQACLLRMRPILMTTMAAIFGAVPLAVSFGVGAELRQPLGISIVGGLLVSQILTLYTVPVIYLYLDRLRGALSAA
jgi:multidrug efflux pump subunit AcrB